MPVTTPVIALTEIILVLFTVHVPPAIELVSIAEEPAQILDGPSITVGAAFTVTILLLAQPEGST